MYSIGQVARLLQVHSQTLRNWEKQGLISPKRFGQARIYSENDINLCRKIKRFSGHGIQLQIIKQALQQKSTITIKGGKVHEH